MVADSGQQKNFRSLRLQEFRSLLSLRLYGFTDYTIRLLTAYAGFAALQPPWHGKNRLAGTGHSMTTYTDSQVIVLSQSGLPAGQSNFQTNYAYLCHLNNDVHRGYIVFL